MSDQKALYEQWIPVIGRSLAYLCLHTGELKEKTLAERAKFLESLGLERKQVAGMLGTTSASITETLSRVKREKKGAKRGGKRSGQKSKARKGR